ncbi:MAG: histidine kinase, partial [Brachymonas sp.]
PLPWLLWRWFISAALLGMLGCVLAFAMRVAAWERWAWVRWYEKSIFGWLAVYILLSALVWYGDDLAFTALLWVQRVFSVLILLLVIFYVAKEWRSRDRAVKLMIAAMILHMMVGIRDFWITQGRSFDAMSTNIPALGYAAVMFYIVISRFRAASAQARELMHTLEARVALREAELAASYSQLEQLARAQAQEQERTRILRDMHDGVGAHISAAIRQVEHGQNDPGSGSQAQRTELLQTLRDSLDQLKLSIDAMHLQAGDITALLANLRYRLEPRLQRSGIELEWAVDLLPEQPQFDHAALRQLQFMLFESFSNVLQHSGASHLRLAASEKAGRIGISLTDNGKGFDPNQPSRGLASMRERAKAIAATVTIHSKEGETKVEISWSAAHKATV